LKLGIGHPVLHFDRIDSTNAEARRLAEAGERGPLWILADMQTGGRGRMGRSWVSEPGNLYATFLFAIAAGPEAAAQVSFVAALAVHDMVMALKPQASPRIKWPNDVLLGHAKVCGILPEMVAASPTTIALGCGINVAHAPAGTPYPVAALDGAVTVESVLQELDSSLSNRLAMWNEGHGFAGIRRAWLERAFGVGGRVSVQAAEHEISGTFTSIAADGALILTLSGGQQKHIHSGEVRFAELEALRGAAS